MRVSLTDAKGQLTDPVRRAESGEEVILTRHGLPAARLIPIKAAPDRKARRSNLEAAHRSGVDKAGKETDAARSQDFLYGDDGLPG
ncbi:type II toxin-antitoxin system Phd/YefM family antitoxin [Phenylobacterium sp.]|uniref:type II toxin-antitoxin system Phd/YefM family antitoxin n=1 Tax=Phenylobacterium sp. TaxID=1871053 RepID=UPI002723D44F|nr:type II toxin-antitoxin system prevent-host-death family antitoxin [Phenylobacterium sp.]MDO8378583.1 type II toxin-antitoxin system prevent-host-death family antitoxin [Phenylobacterium sp.]